MAFFSVNISTRDSLKLGLVYCRCPVLLSIAEYFGLVYDGLKTLKGVNFILLLIRKKVFLFFL